MSRAMHITGKWQILSDLSERLEYIQRLTFKSISSCWGLSDSYGSLHIFSTSTIRFLYPVICRRQAWREISNLRFKNRRSTHEEKQNIFFGICSFDVCATELFIFIWCLGNCSSGIRVIEAGFLTESPHGQLWNLAKIYLSLWPFLKPNCNNMA